MVTGAMDGVDWNCGGERHGEEMERIRCRGSRREIE